MRKRISIKGMGGEWEFEVEKASDGIYTMRPLAYPKSDKVDAMTCNEFHASGDCYRTYGVRTLIRDHVERWRSNGKLKTWVTRPDEFRLPLKFGMRTFNELTHKNGNMLHPADKCPMNLAPETREALEKLLEGAEELATQGEMPTGYVSKVYPAGVPREGEWVHAWSTPVMPGLSFEYFPEQQQAQDASDKFVTRHARKRTFTPIWKQRVSEFKEKFGRDPVDNAEVLFMREHSTITPADRNSIPIPPPWEAPELYEAESEGEGQ